MSIKTAKDKKAFSQLRQSLARLANDSRQIVEPFYSDKPVIKGSVYELKTKCGKPGCKCAQGHLHHRTVLSASEKGKTQLRAIPRGFLAEVQRKIVRLIDEMEAMRREELPLADTKRAPPQG
jgi:hypothetical protein